MKQMSRLLIIIFCMGLYGEIHSMQRQKTALRTFRQLAPACLITALLVQPTMVHAVPAETLAPTGADKSLNVAEPVTLAQQHIPQVSSTVVENDDDVFELIPHKSSFVYKAAAGFILGTSLVFGCIAYYVSLSRALNNSAE